MSQVAELYNAARPASDVCREGVAAYTSEHLTLRFFLESLKSHVAELPSAWVVAEVISAYAKNGVWYLELSENDPLGRRTASAHARLWQNPEMVLGAFRAVAGENPKPGMRLLVRLKAQIHPAHGFSLSIESIDGRFTLGDIEQRLQAMRQKLREAGFFDRNRTHSCPDDFSRVAVISPTGAAALGDFREVADKLERVGLCRFDYHTAIFQGIAAADSLLAAMHTVVRAHKQEAYCALCVIRGGGSATDLADLNQYRIAHAVCHIPLPVLTGIGHERDNVILDDVASRRFDTPSKLILHIEQTIRASAQSARADWLTIQSDARRCAERAARETESLREIVATASRAQTFAASGEIEGDRQAVASSANAALPRVRQELDDLWRDVGDGSRRAIGDARQSAAADMEMVVGLGPRHTLARGFAIVRDRAGRVVGSHRAAESAIGSDLTIEFHDGTLPVRRTDREI